MGFAKKIAKKAADKAADKAKDKAKNAGKRVINGSNYCAKSPSSRHQYVSAGKGLPGVVHCRHCGRG